jgi:hypothetical protein
MALQVLGKVSPVILHANTPHHRIHHLSPVISSEGSDAELTKNQDLEYKDRISKQNKIVAKWALQWKSIIASSLCETLYPYGLYIRALDLRNLSDLFEDPKFRDVALDSFFAGGMAQFMKSQDTPIKEKKRGGKGGKSERKCFI